MNKLRKLLLISDGLFLLSGSLLGPIYALFVKDIGGDLLDASSAFAIFMITAAAVTYLLARLEDKELHKRKFIILGYAVAVIGTGGYLLVNSTFSLFIVQAILGFAVALKDPAYDALFSLSAGKRHLALVWGEWEAVDYLALGIGALVGGFIAQYLGFQALLWLMFSISIISLLVSVLLLKIRLRESQ